MEDVQYSGGLQCRGGARSVRTRVYSTALSHHQCFGGYGLQISHIISGDNGVQYRTTETAQGVRGGCIYLGK